MAASSLFLKALERVDSSSLSFFSLALSASERLAPAWTKLLVDDFEEACASGSSCERFALVVDGLRHALKELRRRGRSRRGARRVSGLRLLRPFCSVGLVLAPVTASKAAIARCSSWPVFSIATKVLSKVGGAGLSAMARISSMLLRHAGFDGGLVVGVFDLVEGRRLKRQSAGRVEGIVGAEGGCRSIGLVASQGKSKGGHGSSHYE